MNKEKLKVVWLCYFINKEVQDRLKPYKSINEFAPWIPISIRILENDDNVELHVISPHEYIRGKINYYFYNAHMPLTGRH